LHEERASAVLAAIGVGYGMGTIVIWAIKAGSGKAVPKRFAAPVPATVGYSVGR
jgi:hypothetical protein